MRTWFLVPFVLVLAGCPEKKPAAESDASTASAASSASAEAKNGGGRHMAHCPSAVDGAKTAVKDTPEGVVVTVTGPADKVNEIRERAKHVAEVAKKGDSAKVEHSGNGTGNGGIGRCPIVVEGDTTVEVKDVEGGIEATVKAKKDAVALQKETKTRATNFGKP